MGFAAIPALVTGGLGIAKAITSGGSSGSSAATIQPQNYSNLWQGQSSYYSPQLSPAPTLSPVLPNLSSFYTGQQLAMTDTENQALSQEQQGNLAMNEAGLSAQQKVNDVNEWRGNAAMQYNGSGVLLEGSPLLVLEQARQMGAQEVQAIQNRGLAQAQLAYQQAGITRNQGRAQLLGQDSQLDGTLAQAMTSQAQQNIQSWAQSGQANINAITQQHAQYLSNLAASGSTRFTPTNYNPTFGNGAQQIGSALDNLIGTGAQGLSNYFGNSGNSNVSVITPFGDMDNGLFD